MKHPDDFILGEHYQESTIRKQIESRKFVVEATANWDTPSGKRRSAPIYEAEVENEYLNKRRTVKGMTTDELERKVQEVVKTWAEQEIRKRIADGKRDAKEQGQAEAQRLDTEAKLTITQAKGLLAATLAVDDRLDWDEERDTRQYKAFSFPDPPQQPASRELILPPKPGLGWLLPGRLRKWDDACEKKESLHRDAEAKAQEDWQEAVRQYEKAREEARQQHESDKAQFLNEQERSNKALTQFRRAFEAGEVSAIVEYCSRVLERSHYPDWVVMSNEVEFDEDSGFVVVDLELPAVETTSTTAGYKFVSRNNSAEPIPLKKKEADALYESILDQLVLRTIHEIVEACYIETVKGVLLNGWVTSTDRATGNDSRQRLRSVLANRAVFEAFDLNRIDPAACIQRLSEEVGQVE